MMDQKSKRVLELEEKLHRVKMDLKAAERKEEEIRRKQETRRKIVMGGIFIREIANGNKDLESIFIEKLKASLPKTQAVFPEYREQLNELA